MTIFFGRFNGVRVSFIRFRGLSVWLDDLVKLSRHVAEMKALGGTVYANVVVRKERKSQNHMAKIVYDHELLNKVFAHKRKTKGGALKDACPSVVCYSNILMLAFPRSN